MICILTAFKKEIDPFLDSLENAVRRRGSTLPVYEGSLNGVPVRIVRTGVGGKKMEPRILFGCSLLLSAGFCGALVPELRTGEIAVATAVIRATGARHRGSEMNGDVRCHGLNAEAFDLSPEMKKVCEHSSVECDIQVRFGPTLTVSGVIRSPGEKAELHAWSGALSVEMEDSFRLVIAKSLGVPFISIRVVLDEIGDQVPSPRSTARLSGGLIFLPGKMGRSSRALASFLTCFIRRYAGEKFETT